MLESMVTIAIFSFIVIGIYGVLDVGKIAYDTNFVSLNLQRQARQGMSLLSREIRQAYLSSIPDKDTNRHSITFNRPGANDVTYSLVSGQLWRVCLTGTVIANDIVGLTFSPIVGNVQKITLEVSKTFRSLGKDYALTFFLIEQVRIRNP